MYIPTMEDLSSVEDLLFTRPEILAGLVVTLIALTGLIILALIRCNCPSRLPRCLRPKNYEKYDPVDLANDVELNDIVVDSQKNDAQTDSLEIEDPKKEEPVTEQKVYGPHDVLGSNFEQIFFYIIKKPSRLLHSYLYDTPKTSTENLPTTTKQNNPTLHLNNLQNSDLYKTTNLTTPRLQSTSSDPKHLTSKPNFLNISSCPKQQPKNSLSYSFPPFSDPSSPSSSDSEGLPNIDSLRRSKKRKAISSLNDEPDHWMQEERHYLLPSLPVTKAEVIGRPERSFTRKLPKGAEAEFHIYNY